MTQYDYATDPTGARAGDGGSMADQVKDQVKDKAQIAQEKAKAATGQARSRFREQVDQRSTQAGERATGTAQDARSVAEELRRQGKDAPARLAERAADRVEHVGRYLQSADADRLLADAEDFARRRPWAVVAGGLALGFAASRLLKASSSQRYRSYQDSGRGRSWFDDADYDRAGYARADYASETYVGTAPTTDPPYTGTAPTTDPPYTGTAPTADPAYTGTAPTADPPYRGTASTTDPAYTGSDYATRRSYPEPVSEPLGTEAPPVTGTYDPDPETTRAPVDAYDAPATEPVDTRRRPSDPDPLT